ncbi:MAG: ABC transporter permease [Oscillochloris sp.]|nr:ABC transporter permease [Oscillochloris sp.]
MARYINLYGYFLLQRFKILMEYRMNFLIGVVSMLFVQGAGILAIWVVMRQIPDLNGWRYDEILLIYGILMLSRSISHMLADNLWTVGRHYIRTGGFDRFLVRPIDPLFHLLADRFCHDGIGTLLVGLALVVKASFGLGLVWTVGMLAYTTVMVISGGLIFIALMLMTATTSFWIMDSIPVTRVVHEMYEFAKYPLTIYHGGISFLLTWIFPFALASFYPASFLLGRDVGWLAWFPPLMAAVLLSGAYAIWRFGLRHYSGTGS